MNAARERVWVTGLGLVTALGPSREATWAALREGRSAARWLDEAGPMRDRRIAAFAAPGPVRSPAECLDLAADEAVRDAGLVALSGESRLDRDRAAVVIGFSKGDMRWLSALHVNFDRDTPAPSTAKPRPGEAWTDCWPGGLAARVGLRYGFCGPRLAPIAACATGVVAALRAADLIRRGECDVALAGAGDSQLEPLVLAALTSMRVLARVGDDPTRAVRPLDLARSGFLTGEGAAVLVLEREGHARGRGARPYAVLAGGAMGSDAYHLTDQDPDPASLAYVVRTALGRANLASSGLDYINLHGTATRGNDPLECRALRAALGPCTETIACSANKSQIGHLLGAAGAAELAITCLAIRDGFIPPTLNLDDPDPACDLDATPRAGCTQTIRAALKLSLGFGGHLAAAVLCRP